MSLWNIHSCHIFFYKMATFWKKDHFLITSLIFVDFFKNSKNIWELEREYMRYEAREKFIKKNRISENFKSIGSVELEKSGTSFWKSQFWEKCVKIFAKGRKWKKISWPNSCIFENNLNLKKSSRTYIFA